MRSSIAINQSKEIKMSPQQIVCYLLLFFMSGALTLTEVEELRVLRQLDQEAGNAENDMDEASGDETEAPTKHTRIVDTVGSVRWVTYKKSKKDREVKVANQKDAEDMLRKINLPAKDYRAYTRGSSDRVTGSLLEFESYDMSLVWREVNSRRENLDFLSTSEYPGYAIGFLNHGEGCSASLIGPYFALTTADCVYNTNISQWYRNFDLLRGRNCNTYLQHLKWESVKIPYEYYIYGNEDFNWAFIQYESSVKSPLWLSLTHDPSLSSRFTAVTINGYSARKPEGCPYTTVCVITACIESTNLVTLGCDVNISFPGAPIIAKDYLVNTTKTLPIYAVGKDCNDSHLCSAVKITKVMFWLMCHWMKEGGYDPECQQRKLEFPRIIIPLEED